MTKMKTRMTAMTIMATIRTSTSTNKRRVNKGL
jgi:hypothetical protein